MKVLGLQGSPRQGGNTSFLLSLFMQEAEKLGASTQTLEIGHMNIAPCTGCRICERKGFCFIEDNVEKEIFPLFRRAELIVAASPIFFYSTTSHLKALIDRSQTLWSRKYKLMLKDPSAHYRKGYLLALGATRGKNLFEGVNLTAKYFFDAISADFQGSLTYRQIEKKGDMSKHPDVLNDVKETVEVLIKPFMSRKKVVFACRENACRSQMAGAFARYFAGDKIEVVTAGSTPVSNINPLMVQVMEEKGFDMAFYKPKLLDEVIASGVPDTIVTMGCGEECPYIPGVKKEYWDLEDPADKSIEFMRNVRDKIEERVKDFISSFV